MSAECICIEDHGCNYGEYQQITTLEHITPFRTPRFGHLFHRTVHYEFMLLLKWFQISNVLSQQLKTKIGFELADGWR